MRAHLDTLEALLACTTPDELRRSVSEYVKVLGFDSWVYAANPTGQNAFPYVLSAYPTAWLKRCIENGLFGVDPVVNVALVETSTASRRPLIAWPRISSDAPPE